MILYHKHNMPDMQVRTLAFIGDAGGGISDEKNKIFFVPYLTLAESHCLMAGKKQIQTQENTISENEYTSLLDARDKLCHFCQSDECDKCQISRLTDDAHNEAVRAGILSDF